MMNYEKKYLIFSVFGILCLINAWSCNSEDPLMETIHEKVEEDSVLSRSAPYHQDFVRLFWCENVADVAEAKWIIDEWLQSSNSFRYYFYEKRKESDLMVEYLFINSFHPFPGSYDPETKEMTFRSLQSMQESFPEEFAHYLQDALYENGISQYKHYGKIDIEFEAKFLVDLVGLAEGWGGMMRGTGEYYASEYSSWIIDLYYKETYTFNEIFEGRQGITYHDFMYDFEQKKSYDGIAEFMVPRLLDWFLY